MFLANFIGNWQTLRLTFHQPTFCPATFVKPYFCEQSISKIGQILIKPHQDEEQLASGVGMKPNIMDILQIEATKRLHVPNKYKAKWLMIVLYRLQSDFDDAS